MIRFERYSEKYHHDLVSVFRSNVPEYFLDSEEKDLFKDIPDFADTYFVMLLNEQIIGAGGYALNPDDTVSLCWGMIHRSLHKQKFGKALLEFRLDEIKKQLPGKTIVNTTSQHNLGFFERYGFKTVSVVKDGIGPGLNTCKMELKTN